MLICSHWATGDRSWKFRGREEIPVGEVTQEEFPFGEGSTLSKSETKITLSPEAPSSDATKLVPAGNGRKVSAMPVETTEGSGRGTEIEEPLTGIIDNAFGGLKVVFVPENEIIIGSHCCTSVILNLRAWAGATCVPSARNCNRRATRRSIVDPEVPGAGLARRQENESGRKGGREKSSDQRRGAVIRLHFFLRHWWCP